MINVSRSQGAFTPPATAPQGLLPSRMVGGWWITCFALSWLGVWVAQLTPIQLLLQLQLEQLLNTSGWVANILEFGVILGIAGVFAVVAYPLTGALSDRTTSRFGRRRPWIAGGTAGFAVSLVLLGMEGTLWGTVLCWVVASVLFCVVTAALTAAICDQVPIRQRGYVSGWISAPHAIGIIAGLALVTRLGLVTLGGYVLVAGLFVDLALPFLLFVPDEVLPPLTMAPLSVHSLIENMWIGPRHFPDFGWILLSLILVNLGNARDTRLLLYFLMYGLTVTDPESSLLLLSLVYMVFVILASLTQGRLSDRVGRRKPLVLGASARQAVAALVLASAPSTDAALVAAALLGIMNIALTVPQAFAPMLGTLLVSSTGGFTLLFIASALTALAGAAAVSRVKGVR